MDDAALRQLWEQTIPSAHEWNQLPPEATYRRQAAETTQLRGAATPRGRSVPATGYELLQEIGRGGMGVVFRPLQASLRREIAIKVVRPDAASPETESSFLSEAMVTGLLDHPNIVPVYDLAPSPEGGVRLAMKLVGGTSWKALLHPKGPDQTRRAALVDLSGHLQILISVCNAVAFAHSKGIVHRDLKPENVMVGDFGEVLVMDWGLAVDVTTPHDPDRQLPHRSEISGPAGTPCYMAPELAEGRGADVGPWTDIYLLGAILHEIVTGRAPHRSDTLLGVLKSAVTSDPPQFPPDAPRELQAICRRAMSRDPATRYPTVAEFHSRLREFLEHRESTRLAARAEEILEACVASSRSTAAEARHTLYRDFAESVAGFRQARTLWEGNRQALEGERRARLAFATAACDAGDLGLAEAQVLDLEGADALRERLASAREARRKSKRNGAILRWSVAAACAVIIVGLGGSYVAVWSEQRRTAGERDRADAEKRTAEGERSRARLALAQIHLASSRRLAEIGDDAGAAWHAAAAISYDPGDAARVCAAQAIRGLGVLERQHWEVVAISSDGKQLLRGNWIRRVWLVTTASDERLSKEMTPDIGEYVTLTAIGPRGACIATAGEHDGHLRLLESGASVKLRHGIREFAFSPDGARVAATCNDGFVRLWNAVTGEELAAERPGGRIGTLVFGPDGRRVAVGGDAGVVHLLDGSTLKPSGRPMAHTGAVTALAFSPDGASLLTAAGSAAHLWSTATGRQVGTALKHDLQVSAISFGPDNRRVATASYDRTARLWDARTGLPLGPPLRHAREVTRVKLGRDGQSLITACGDKAVRIWEDGQQTEAPAQTLWHGADIEAVVLTDEGRLLTHDADGDIRIWMLDEGRARRKPVWKDDAEVTCASPDGLWVASQKAGSGLRVWNLDAPDSTGVKYDPGRGRLVAIAPDGRRGVQRIGDGARLVDLETGKDLGGEIRHDRAVEHLVFSPDGKRLATSAWDDTVRLWDGETGAALARPMPQAKSVTALTFSADGGRLYTTYREDYIGVWSARDGESLGVAGLLKKKITRIVASPDGGSLLLGEGRLVRILDLKTGELKGQAMQHDDEVRAIAVSRDGRWIATGGLDQTCRLWDGRTGVPIGPPQRVRSPVLHLAFCGDGSRLAVGCDRGTELWDVSFLTSPPSAAVIQLRARVYTGLENHDTREVLPEHIWRGAGDDLRKLEAGK